MKSKVCKIANNLKGVSRSEAFRKAWAIAKIDNLEEKQFAINMVDFWSDSDREKYIRISREMAILREHGKTEIEKEADHKAKEQQEVENANAEHKLFEDMGFAWDEAQDAWTPIKTEAA